MSNKNGMHHEEAGLSQRRYVIYCRLVQLFGIPTG